MKAAVFHKPGDVRYDTVSDPRIEQLTKTPTKQNRQPGIEAKMDPAPALKSC